MRGTDTAHLIALLLLLLFLALSPACFAAGAGIFSFRLACGGVEYCAKALEPVRYAHTFPILQALCLSEPTPKNFYCA